ncbi:MAG: hypothetical protein KDB27_32310 [Planctomycetales bacterium]|nr:hypothetical protein [Planctomycetales bacterium]
MSKARTHHRKRHLERLETRCLLAADISGHIYNDVNDNGVRDQGEDGLVGWTVYLDLNENGSLDTSEPTSLSEGDGVYRFQGLSPGSYVVAEVVRVGWTATAPVSGAQPVTAVDGETVEADFLNHGAGGTGSITGNVWRDLNNDGIQDPGDTGIAGWKVYLDFNGDKILDPDEPFEVTDGNGDYTFTGVLGGVSGEVLDYEVQQILPDGWEPGKNSNENLTASVIEGEVTVLEDFWNTPIDSARVEGTVWNDLNGNGIQDISEPGLSSWTVYADMNQNGVLDAGEPSAVTNASGDYSLFIFETGTHRIAEVKDPNYKPTSPATGYRTVIAPTTGTTSNVDFGNQLRTEAAIGGVAFADRNHNGARDADEEGLPGITVFLDDNNNGVLDAGERSVVTSEDLFYTPSIDESGVYRFEDLSGGTYTVVQLLPDELSATPETEREHSVTVGPTEDRSDLDSADRYRPSEIHGMKFEDVNGNGIHDTGEPGIEGVTVYIDLNRNAMMDAAEPRTLTGPDGTYSFFGLDTDSYVVREIVAPGYVQTFPMSEGGILWPEGTSNSASGIVSPSIIQTSVERGQTYTETVSLTLPTSGPITDKVDVFLLFDDTGSFTRNSPIVRAAFPNIIADLQTKLPGIDLGFGVGRLEEYGGFAAEYSSGRPFILNQPIIAASVPGFSASIQAALDRVAPGYGGDRPETVIEALYQLVTGIGFDGNDNGSTLDSGVAGGVATQTAPGNSGDVPPFSSFTADPANSVLPASGAVGGAGFRSGALPIIITATDTGFAYQPLSDATIVGIDGLTLPRSQVTFNGRGTTPFSAGAGVQQTVTGLNALGALVIGLGTNDSAASDPRIGLEALASLTGAINRTTNTLSNGTPDAIAPGDPLYFKIGSGGDPLVGNIADGIVTAVDGAVTSVSVNVTLRSSDSSVKIDFTPGVINGLRAGETATFDVTFTGDGRPHRFDLQFVREGTDVVLGSIPVVLGTPIEGDGYEYEDCHDGEICAGSDFGNQSTASESAGPRIVDVKVAGRTGSIWKPQFLEVVDAAKMQGYSLTGSNQLKNLTWKNVDSIYLQFSEDVGTFSDSDFTLTGVNTPVYSTTTSYDSSKFLATIALAADLSADKLRLRILDGVVSDGTNSLDGEWSDGDSIISGDGVPGGAFDFRFEVLPGDVNQSNGVTAADTIAVRNAEFTFAGGAGYDPFFDLDGSGGNASTDTISVRNSEFTFLPPVPTSVAAAANGKVVVDAVKRRKLARIDQLFQRFGNDQRDKRRKYYLERTL